MVKRKEYPPVEMPDKTSTKKGAGGSRYVYLTTRAYRNASGKPTSDEAMIGKLAPDGVSLIPNQRYFEFFPESKPSIKSAKALGATATMYMLAERLGLTSLLKRVFSARAEMMLDCAGYMVNEGCVMAYLGDFSDESFVLASPPLGSQGASELFESITDAERSEFFLSWIKKISESEYIAYDVTSFSTYSGGIEDAEWGHNRDSDCLAQVNLGMFLGITTHTPAYYMTYQGSVLDKTHLLPMMDSAAILGIGSVRFVFDRGFVTSENLAYVANEHLSFVTAIPSSLLDYKEVLKQAKAAGIASSANALPAERLYALAIPHKVLGTKMTCHVYYSPTKRAGEEEIVYAKIMNLEADLTKLSVKKSLPKKYRDHFKVVTGEASVASFERDYEKTDEQISKAGFFVLATDDETLSSKEVLDTYRRKDAIEKAFSGMKNTLDLKRLRVHSSATASGKLFCGFLALIILMYIREALNSDAKTQGISVESAIKELKKLKRIIYPDGSVQHTTVTKKQREILQALDIAADNLLSYGLDD